MNSAKTMQIQTQIRLTRRKYLNAVKIKGINEFTKYFT